MTVTWKDGKAIVQVGGASGPAVVVKPDFVYLGGDPDTGGFADAVILAVHGAVDGGMLGE